MQHDVLQKAKSTSLLDIEQITNDLKTASSPITVLKKIIQTVNEQQSEQFDKGNNIVHLVHDRCKIIDEILELCWNYYQINQYQVCLAAVGGYGRGELHPYSDVDILILHNDEALIEKKETENSDSLAQKLQLFITLLWDIGLDLGQSVRTISECVNEAGNDITIISNLMESRFLTGNKELFNQLKKAIEPEKIWDTKDFFRAKIEEQSKRHQKFNDTAYNL